MNRKAKTSPLRSCPSTTSAKRSRPRLITRAPVPLGLLPSAGGCANSGQQKRRDQVERSAQAVRVIVPAYKDVLCIFMDVAIHPKLALRKLNRHELRTSSEYLAAKPQAHRSRAARVARVVRAERRSALDRRILRPDQRNASAHSPLVPDVLSAARCDASREVDPDSATRPAKARQRSAPAPVFLSECPRDESVAEKPMAESRKRFRF